MKKILFGIVALLLAASCTQEVNNTAELGGISGVVADKTTGEPVPVVNVKLKETGASTVTGSDGSFTFKDLENGQYTVLLSKEGYKDNSSTVQVTNSKTLESHFLIERIPAVLTIDREVLDFGENYSNTTLSFSMVNKNYVDLDWEIKYNCRWIKEVDPMKSITNLGYGKTQTVVVIIDRDALLAGDNETVIVVTTSDGASELKVKAYGQPKRVPALNMDKTSGLTATTAVLNAEITDKGIPDYTERGFVLGESEMPTKESALKILPAAVTAENTFSVRVSELTMGKTYYVRAYATNEVGTAFSTNQDVFTTPASLPTLSMSASTDVKATSAILNAEITDKGTPEYTERGFVVGDAEMPTKETALQIIPAAVNADNKFSVRVGDLTLGQRYYIRAYATNQLGTAFSTNQDSFVTTAILPTVVTMEATSEDRETQTAVLRGSITYEGDPAYTERGFVWSTDYDIPTIEEEKIVISGTGVGDYEKRIAFPSIDKTIFVRAYATNARGTAYGETVQVFQQDYLVLKANNLGVQRTDINPVGLEWSDAYSMCKNSRVGSLNDWRLPTKDELFQLYNLKEEIGGFTKMRYWSSSSYNNYFYYVDFSNGDSDIQYASYCHHARCVRTLE